MMAIIESGDWLPLVFAALMALAVLVYAVLDGYDIGIGILMNDAGPKERDRMISSIGPFWDANETWLVLAVGLLLIAFPEANGIVLTNLYLPVVLMLIGLILRGVSFDFRAKARVEHKDLWDRVFTGGSFMMAISQGYMVGQYVLGFKSGAWSLLFGLMTGLSVAAAYALIGAGWLILKTEGELQKKAVRWAQKALYGMVAAIVLIGLASPLASDHVYSRWVAYPDLLWLVPIPVLVAVCIWRLDGVLKKLPAPGDADCWKPFALTASVFTLCLVALAYSFYPYIVPGKLKIVEAASARESLLIILFGALAVLPFLIGYTIFAYKVFAGKTRDLSYD